MLSIPVVVLSAALFLALVANLALKPSFSSRLTLYCMVVSAAAGLFFYGVGFAEETGNRMVSVVRTPLAVTRMFAGINEYSVIENTLPVRSSLGLTLFWLTHMLAFFSTASAVLVTIGAAALRQLRLMLSRRGDLVVFFGINDNTIAVGKECLAQGGSSVVFIAETADSTVISDLNGMGMSVITGQDAIDSGEVTIRALHPVGRKVTVYALDPSEDQNLYYALKLKDALERAGIPPENTRITLPGEEEIISSMLQVSPDRYGFGYVHVYNTGDLAARAMLRICPPWDFISFDENGKAREDFDCVVIGFGRFGQAALKRLVMNAQFSGSSFHAAVFSPQIANESGYLLTDSQELFSQYDISLISADGRSRELYEYVSTHLSTLKLIAVCTGREEMDREISDSLMMFLKRRQAEHIGVVQCSRRGARYQETVGSPIVTMGIHNLTMLSAEAADRGAIVLNSVYDSSDRSDWEKWVACDTFSKMSSRASADFLPAFLKAAGRTREQALADGGWDLPPAMLYTLGETEHKRWNAFHFALGYAPMTDAEFDANAERYVRQRLSGEPVTVRITKNQSARTHACLIPWEDLDALSARENAVTGKNTDYKQVDINNVLALPQLLRKEEGIG